MDISDLKDVRRCWRTASLFRETCEDPVKYPPIYSFANDHDEIASLKRNYLDMGDVGEYTFATTYLGGWDHWMLICKSWSLKDYIENMRSELRLKIASESLAKIREIAEGTSPAALQAAKYLYERESTDSGRKRGRPSKQEKEQALQRELRSSEDIHSDAKRLGLTIVK